MRVDDTRAARWSTLQVGRAVCVVLDVARGLGCGWHTVMDAVVVIGEQLIDHPDRFGDVTAWVARRPCSHGWLGSVLQSWSTQIVDVRRGQLLDVVPGRTASEPCRWLKKRDQARPDRIQVGHPRSVGQLSQRVRHDAAPRHPSRGSVPRSPARQPWPRLVPPTRAERDVRASWPTWTIPSTGLGADSASRRNDSPTINMIGSSVCCVPATPDRGVVRTGNGARSRPRHPPSH